jgi:hypothetical protein
MEYVIDPQGQRLFRYDLIDILNGARARDAMGRELRLVLWFAATAER